MPWLVLVVLSACACGAACERGTDEHGSTASESDEAPVVEEPAEPATSSAGEDGEGTPPALPAGGDGFDPRLAVLDADAHVGEERLCDVAFAERLVDVAGRERERYPLPVARRVAVQCAADTGLGWADLVFTAERASSASAVEAGKRVRVRVVDPDGGFADYPVLELLELVGPVAIPPALDEPSAPEPGFDFGRAGDPGVAGSVRPCAVDFAGRVEILDDRQRRLHPYPEDATHRVPVKCLHGRGDHWIDLILTDESASSALGIRRGATVPIRVLAAEGGFAGRPIGALGTD